MENFLLYDDERINDINDKLKLIEKKNGLTFGTDAYMLSAFIRAQKKARAAELGSGTGIISLLCAAREKFSHITAIEIQSEFSSLAERNILLNSLTDKITPLCADIREVDSQSTFGELDVVFSNPPYMSKDSGKRNLADEKHIARHEVCGNINDFCKSAERLLKFGGLFYCVYRPDRLCDLICSLRNNNLEPKKITFICADTKTPPSIVLIEAKKGASPSLALTKSIYIYKDTNENGQRIMTEEADMIYKTGAID